MPKVKRITPTVFVQTPFTAEQQETIFKSEYEFNQQTPARSPVSGWEYKAAKEGSSYNKKADSLIKGSPSVFRGIRTNNSYGNRLAVKRIRGK